MMTKDFWTYNESLYSLYITPDVPLAIVLGWCLLFNLTLLISSVIIKRMREKSEVIFVLIGVSLGTFIGTAFECFCYTVLKGWTYWKDLLIIPYLGIPIATMFGYFVLMFFFIPTIRFYDKEIEELISD